MCYLYKCELAAVVGMFLKKVLTISNGMNMSLLPSCFSLLKMYIQKLNYQVFPMKTTEAFQIWTKCVENKWEGNRVPVGERKLLFVPKQKCHRIIFHILCDMGLPCLKLSNSNLIKDRNIIFAVSKRYINIL